MRIFTLKVFLLLLFIASSADGQKISTEFSFTFENKKYVGLIDLPVTGNARSIIILIPGSGKTYFIEKNGYNKVRTFFVSQGFAVCLWDRWRCLTQPGTSRS